MPRAGSPTAGAPSPAERLTGHQRGVPRIVESHHHVGDLDRARGLVVVVEGRQRPGVLGRRAPPARGRGRQRRWTVRSNGSPRPSSSSPLTMSTVRAGTDRAGSRVDRLRRAGRAATAGRSGPRRAGRAPRGAAPPASSHPAKRRHPRGRIRGAATRRARTSEERTCTAGRPSARSRSSRASRGRPARRTRGPSTATRATARALGEPAGQPHRQLGRRHRRVVPAQAASLALTSATLGLVSAVPSGNTRVGTVRLPPIDLHDEVAAASSTCSMSTSS